MRPFPDMELSTLPSCVTKRLRSIQSVQNTLFTEDPAEYQDRLAEFGLDENGVIILGDEMLTPDSSRFWPLEGYLEGQPQPSFDKQYVRDWLKGHPDSDYLLPDDVIEKTIERYEEAYELLTGIRM